MKKNIIRAALAGAFLVSTGAFAGVEIVGQNTFRDEVVAQTTPVTKKVKSGPSKNSYQLIIENDAVALSDKARAEASKKWVSEGAADALIGTNGQVEYAYGQSRPTIVCAPLHLCTIQLLDGENITSMAIGDSVRWVVQQAKAGSKPVVVVKPTQSGLNTNLTVMTDAGRVYYMTLQSHKTDYVPLVGFYDPQALVMNFDKQASEARARQIQSEQDATSLQQSYNRRVAALVPARNNDVTSLNFDWTCKADKEGSKFLPTRAFSGDGHVYLQMPDSVKTGEAPVVFNVSTGETELLNFRLSGDYYIVDGNPSKLQLVIGSKEKMRTATCEQAASKKVSWSDGKKANFPGFGVNSLGD